MEMIRLKRIGILGGMAPESTREYYRILNNLAKEKDLDEGYPEIVIFSLNFEEFCKRMRSKDYSKVIQLLKDGIESLEGAGVDFVIIASNTPHMFFKEIQEHSKVPILSIAEATAEEASKNGYQKVGLLGTRITMEGEFYEEEFKQRNIRMVIPSENEMDYIDEKIFSELTEGEFFKQTKKNIIDIIERMEQDDDIDAVVLGCTELPLIITREDLDIPVLNTTELHARKALKYAQ